MENTTPAARIIDERAWSIIDNTCKYQALKACIGLLKQFACFEHLVYLLDKELLPYSAQVTEDIYLE